jgi:hypothetical protein
MPKSILGRILMAPLLGGLFVVFVPMIGFAIVLQSFCAVVLDWVRREVA